MAHFVPVLSSVVGRMTSGERRFARRLESHLEDDYICWYDVPVGSLHQHPDFLVFHPRRGLLDQGDSPGGWQGGADGQPDGAGKAVRASDKATS